MSTMNADTGLAVDTQSDRKPRLALMGEFSAGKSTLSNLLLGFESVPTRVTATRLPPVWISFGDDGALRVDMDGVEHPLEIDEIPEIQLEETRMIKLFLQSDVLNLCDLIDMPGISDPNMSSSVWQNMFSEVDSVVWCTHATQAWRQSEAAAWESIVSQTNGNNLLLVSQFDKLRSERDQQRVLSRVRKETKDMFKGVYPVSLTEALNAGEDVEKWEQSGAALFTDDLVEMLLCRPGTEFASKAGKEDKPLSQPTTALRLTPDMIVNEADLSSKEAELPTSDTPCAIDISDASAAGSAVRPRRVRATAPSQTRDRPQAHSVEYHNDKNMMLKEGECE